MDIRFFSENMFVMSCDFISSDKSFNPQKCLEIQNSSSIYDSNCNKYITAPLEKDGPYYNGYFSIPFENNYKLVLSDNTKHGKRDEQSISFQLQYLDVNVDRNTSSSFFIQFSDSEIVDSEMNISPIFLQSIAQANTYTILTFQSIDIYLRRRIRKFIIPNWKATMGFQPDYIIKPYLTSRKEVTQQLTEFRDDIFTAIFVSLDFDTTTVETEQSSLGLIGGAWSLAVCVYKLLFGDDAIRPFGLIQKYGYFNQRTQKKLSKFLSTLPLVQILDSSKNIVDDDDESRVDQLEKQINDLELFLRDYVVDAQQLDKAHINNERDKNK
ncbi:21123_t:CDS:2 [Gigaspora rosea]|nr:21123_t:CDS:2 [Gigaspora rosea]